MPIRMAAPILIAFLLAGCGDERRAERLRAAGPEPVLAALMAVADADAGAAQFRRRCAACHTVARGAPDRGGPNLHGIFGRGFGRNSAHFAYTAALRDAPGRWDAATLDRWMANPQKLVPGNKMLFPGVPDGLDRADIVAYLQRGAD